MNELSGTLSAIDLPLIRLFLNLGAIFIRGRVAKLQIPRRLADPGLGWSQPRDLLERTHYPKAFQLLASIWSAGPAPRLRKSLMKEYDTGLKKRVSCVRRAKKPTA